MFFSQTLVNEGIGNFTKKPIFLDTSILSEYVLNCPYQLPENHPDMNARYVDGDYDLVPAKTSGWFIFDQLNNLYWENQVTHSIHQTLPSWLGYHG